MNKEEEQQINKLREKLQEFANKYHMTLEEVIETIQKYFHVRNKK